MPALPIISLFTTQKPIIGTMNTKIRSEFEAANYVAEHQAMSNINSDIDKTLRFSPQYPLWRKSMENYDPAINTSELKKYKQSPKQTDTKLIDNEIKFFNSTLSAGQKLFRFDYCSPNCNEIIQLKPLSTTFDPQVAFMQAIHNKQGGNFPTIQLWILTVTSPSTNVYFYDIDDTENLGDELEVLFAPKATLIKTNYHTTSFTCKTLSKKIEILEFNIS
ncbi:TPA: hypothetical protein ACKRXW_002970 [Proteus mirabilis]|uniref:hypothetical protein n=1 Tax=Proteus mirabilis TaxID=584 RepID=UPI000504DF69|nr:hypothetical protein [Proteus mirabilis]DAL41491.1 MAG TPA_asm: hypothetical protein [Caudoviricetes sp.]AUT92102.1 hypothetical protein MC46_010350 [Proteus mirabilis]EKW0544695.1 hypothetical protein [Proteus mirabilis]EKW4849850.1 hypothetical protein [Proteus mirabilis]EKY0560085.1 hypothetical protein [Proteus mirabilis]